LTPCPDGGSVVLERLVAFVEFTILGVSWHMDPGIAAVLGAAVGLFGALIVAGSQARSAKKTRDDQAREDREARKDQARREQQEERLHYYVDLLTTAREVRYISLRTFEKLATRSVSEVDQVLTKMSRAYYLIALTSPGQTAELAGTLRESAFDVWRLARDHPETEKDRWLLEVRKVRGDAERFRLHVREELGIALAEPAEPSADEVAATPSQRKS
jgi:hypothetical protein